MNVEVGLTILDSCDQRGLGLCQPALQGDERRIVETRIRKTKEWREVGPLRHSERESRKRRQRGSDADIGSKRRAAMDVCSAIRRAEAKKRGEDLYRLGRWI
jgi:hypothetical protein